MSVKCFAAVLCARSDSVYKLIDGLDVFDSVRDARTWVGGCPVICHPPCAQWGRLAHFARVNSEEKQLALWCVEQVRRVGGVLEHPAFSSLWDVAGLPLPGAGVDRFGGFTYPISQSWFGHRAEKKTWLYVVGVPVSSLPIIPLWLGDASCVVATRRRTGSRPEISKAEREHTPRALAEWCVELVRLVVDEC